VLTIKLFANRSVFREYMLAFVGFGADVDGVYVENDGVLYTYRRDATESVNTTDETIAHEFGHYLTGRYLFPGAWHDPGYHAEPKGWIDEGLAEYLAGLDSAGSRAALDRLCNRPVPPDLDRLLTQREGYDRYGVFAYDDAWAFVTFLATGTSFRSACNCCSVPRQYVPPDRPDNHHRRTINRRTSGRMARQPDALV
jgi:hypothetical protein